MQKFTAEDARRAYYRAWRAKNRERIKQSNARYWERKAAKLNEGRAKSGDGEDRT